jgi:hypothetical protein
VTNKSQNSDESDYDVSLDSERVSLNRDKFKKKRVEEIDIEARSFFVNTGSNVFECKKCRNPIKIVNRSITNLKSHLGRAHKMIKFLTSSQLRQLYNKSNKKSKISRKEKNELDEMALTAIIIDSQAFNVFSKPGMRKLIEYLKPGYKPLSRKSAAIRLKKKYFYFLL